MQEFPAFISALPTVDIPFTAPLCTQVSARSSSSIRLTATGLSAPVELPD